MFEWQEQKANNISRLSESSSQRVIFFLLYGETNSTKAKGGNRDVIERYDTQKGDTDNTPLVSRMKWRMESTSGLIVAFPVKHTPPYNI